MRTGIIMEHACHHSPAPPLGERSEGLGSERKGTPPPQPAPAGGYALPIPRILPCPRAGAGRGRDDGRDPQPGAGNARLRRAWCRYHCWREEPGASSHPWRHSQTARTDERTQRIPYQEALAHTSALPAIHYPQLVSTTCVSAGMIAIGAGLSDWPGAVRCSSRAGACWIDCRIRSSCACRAVWRAAAMLPRQPYSRFGSWHTVDPAGHEDGGCIRDGHRVGQACMRSLRVDVLLHQVRACVPAVMARPCRRWMECLHRERLQPDLTQRDMWVMHSPLGAGGCPHPSPLPRQKWSGGLGSERKGTPPSQPAPAGDGGITFNSSPQRGEVRRGAEARWAGCIRSTSVTTPPTEAEQGLGGKVKGGSQPTCTPSTA
ncbi:MAG: hypothetical protein KatS3mg056_0460 [Chloroflexus sp.]|nr:MAG: hypothetical protein KatS3mg056_0460 [Chloroflexus sp.]